MYSRSVADSFTIFVDLPEDYDAKRKGGYPVVYLLDANFYFDIMATTIRKYSVVNLVPQVILVGIGYKDFQAMDSLRDRDYTYPTALAQYEMKTSGGAEKFLDFISKEVIPQVEQAYHCDTTRRTLMGHSLGGYFVSYALVQHLSGRDGSFHNYIAASPSLNYNHYYLLHALDTMHVQIDSTVKDRLYVTYGGLEDAEDADDSTMEMNAVTLHRLGGLLSRKAPGRVVYKSDIYSNLGHMDMAPPSFVKGVREIWQWGN
jgi:predicted alpha/beta superfamily hydrolase